jgi:hypothetical protein
MSQSFAQVGAEAAGDEQGAACAGADGAQADLASLQRVLAAERGAAEARLRPLRLRCLRAP